MLAKTRRKSGSTSNTLCSAWLTTTSVLFSLGAPALPPVCSVKSIKENTNASVKEKLMSFLEKNWRNYSYNLSGRCWQSSPSQIHFRLKSISHANNSHRITFFMLLLSAEGCTHVLTACEAG